MPNSLSRYLAKPQWLLCLIPGLVSVTHTASAEPLYLNFTRPPIVSQTLLPYDSSQIRSSFTITLNFSGELTESQKAVFLQAKAAWESRLTGYQPGISNTGVIIDASSVPIDGPWKILGRAGPTRLTGQAGYVLATQGIMEFDSADMAAMESDGFLQEVIEHEMGHVLGIGTLWARNNVYVADSYAFTGVNGLTEWKSEFQSTATAVPVEDEGGQGTAEGHWNENADQSATGITDAQGHDMRNELMTGWINLPVFFSGTTLRSMQDIGFSTIDVPPVSYTLTSSTIKNNGSFGSITGPGISCGSDCTESYTENTEISLSAVADWGSRFAGWSGACPGDEACILNMTEDKPVTATFDIRLPPAPQCYPDTQEVSSAGDFTQDTTIQSMDKITTAGTITMSKHVRLIFEATNGITLNPGFTVPAYGQFLANIQPSVACIL